MADVRLYLSQIENDKKEALQTAQRTAQRIQRKELKLLELVESLGEFINDDKAVIRERALSFLAEVIAAVPNGVIPLQHRSLLLDFVISRLEDHEVGVGLCGKALLALEERGNWDEGQVRKVMSSLLDNTHPLMQNGTQSQRYQILLLLDHIMARYRPVVLQMHIENDKFLAQFIAYFDGEKDPRNLMVVFSILRVVMTEWDISSCIQDVFDAAFNYFPITFRPPPEDAYKVTSQDLKERLRTCLAATPAFAPYALPALFDKLDSTSMNTKRDVLQALYDVVRNYGPKVIGVYSVTLWDTIKFEVLQAQDEELAQESLKVLSAVALVLGRGPRNGLVAYLKLVVKECNEHLEDAPTKQSEAASRILLAVSSSSWLASNIIVSGVVPHIAILYQGTEDVQKKRGLVQALADILRANCTVFGDWQRNPLHQAVSAGEESEAYGAASENSLRQYSSTILTTLLGALSAGPTQNVSYRLTLVDAALQLTKAREVLTDEDISKVIRVFSNIIIALLSSGKDEVKTAAMNAIGEIAQQKPQLVIDECFPMFLSKIPDSDVGYSGTYLPILEAFATIGVQEKIFSTAVLRLQNKWNAALAQNASNAHLRSILSALLYVLKNSTTLASDEMDKLQYYRGLLVPLVALCVNNLQDGSLDDQVLGLIGRISNEIMRAKTSEAQMELAAQIYAAGLDSGPKSARYLILSVHLLGCLQQSVPVGSGADDILRQLMDIYFDDRYSDNSKAAALQHMCLLINKFIPTPDPARVLKPILDHLSEKFDQNAGTQTIMMLFAVLKALILRNAPQQSSLLLKLIGGLNKPLCGHAVAQGFSILLEPDEILSKENHCRISPLCRQKTFSIAVPEICGQFATAEPSVKKNYLIALSGILQWLPYSAFASEVSSLTPLLLLTLEIDDEHSVKAGTINKLSAILQENGEILEERASSLITRLLHISSSASDPPKVREKALQCLTLVASSMKTEIIMPYRKQVVKRLTTPIDDKRRAVRAEAVKCRTKWIGVDEGASDDE